MNPNPLDAPKDPFFDALRYPELSENPLLDFPKEERIEQQTRPFQGNPEEEETIEELKSALRGCHASHEEFKHAREQAELAVDDYAERATLGALTKVLRTRNEVLYSYNNKLHPHLTNLMNTLRILKGKFPHQQGIANELDRSVAHNAAALTKIVTHWGSWPVNLDSMHDQYKQIFETRVNDAKHTKNEALRQARRESKPGERYSPLQSSPLAQPPPTDNTSTLSPPPSPTRRSSSEAPVTESDRRSGAQSAGVNRSSSRGCDGPDSPTTGSSGFPDSASSHQNNRARR
jgi:uncharacterized membrane-anchored protein YhcB (DUF1043 family)